MLAGSHILVKALIDQGAEYIFGYPGGTVINIYDALHDYRDEITHILVSHEQGASHAADGYSRATGKTGVALATSGPGTTNILTGIATAYMDSIPAVFITGNVAYEMLGRDAFQEIDATGLTSPIVKQNFFVKRVEDIPYVVREAFTVANSGRKGPVHIDIPKDLTIHKTEYVKLPKFEPRPTPEISLGDLKAVENAIKKAEKPLLYVGGGVVFSDASSALLKLLEKTNMPVTTSMMGISSVNKEYPYFLGFMGMHGTPTANIASSECDLLIAIGARFSDRTCGTGFKFATNAKIIHVDLDKSEHDKNVKADIKILADSKDFLEKLAETIEPTKFEKWTSYLLRHKAHNPLPIGVSEGITPQKILKALRAATNDDVIVATDVGQHQFFTAQHFAFMKPRSFLSSGGLGTMGFGLGAAIGAKFGNPDRQVVLVTGDGSFHMNMNELAVAVSNDLPIVIVIINNKVLGMVHQWQTLFYEKRYSNTLISRKTDFVKLAEAFGAKGFRVTEPSELLSTFKEALACGCPCVVDCVTEEDERVYPMIPPGGTSSDMIYCD